MIHQTVILIWFIYVIHVVNHESIHAFFLRSIVRWFVESSDKSILRRSVYPRVVSNLNISLILWSAGRLWSRRISVISCIRICTWIAGICLVWSWVAIAVVWIAIRWGVWVFLLTDYTWNGFKVDALLRFLEVDIRFHALL